MTGSSTAETPTDIYSKEVWLDIINNEHPPGVFESSLLNTAINANKKQLEQLRTAYPNLVEAELEHRESMGA